jgi:glycosyltransferase involved in cell wall biosynthesis
MEVGPVRRVGIIGRIAPEKGQLEFLESMRSIRNLVSDIEFLIVGAGSQETHAYTEAVERAARSLNVTFTGWQNDIRSALASMQLLVVPSLAHDAAPRVISEAFSACVPVLATAAGGIPELIDRDSVNGFLTAGTSPTHIAHRMLQVIGLNGHHLHSVACNARRRWEENFRIEHYREAIWDLLQTCTYQPRTVCVAR